MVTSVITLLMIEHKFQDIKRHLALLFSRILGQAKAKKYTLLNYEALLYLHFHSRDLLPQSVDHS